MNDVVKEYLVTVVTTNDKNPETIKILHEGKEIKFKREKSVVTDDEQSVGLDDEQSVSSNDEHPITFHDIYNNPIEIPLLTLDENERRRLLRSTKKPESERAITKSHGEKFILENPLRGQIQKPREKVAKAQGENFKIQKPREKVAKAQGETKNKRLGGRKKTLRKKILRKN